MRLLALIYSGIGCAAFAGATEDAADEIHGRADASLLDSWTGWGGSYFNDRWAPTSRVSSSNIKSLAVQCQIDFPHGVSAPATLHEGIAYFPTWNGSMVALDYSSCEVKWQINVTGIIYGWNSNLTLAQLTASSQVGRTSPQIDPVERVIYFGTQTWALLVAADLDTGKLLGQTQVNPHEVGIVTISPTVYEGRVYVGASSDEEDVALFLDGDYECCSFIGNAAAFEFDRASGEFTTVWNVSTIPPGLDTGGQGGSWAGAGVWGSQPSIDAARRQVYYATGNLYTIPVAYYPCTDPSSPEYHDPTCVPEDVYTESILALDMDTGKPKWTRRLSPIDAWTLVCGVPGALADNTTLCPQTHPGNDSDFGMGASFVPASISLRTGGALSTCGDRHSNDKDVITIGQKNGNVYALTAESGDLEWATLTSPGSAGGGLSWGIATDDEQVYWTGINYLYLNWTLYPSGDTTNSSGYGAVSLATGKKQWSVAAPEGQRSQVYPTVVGDLLLTGWTGPANGTGTGGLLALNKTTGNTVFEYPLNGAFYGGIAVDGDLILLGTGYTQQLGNGSFFVFKVDG